MSKIQLLQCTALHRTLYKVHKKIHWSDLTFHRFISVNLLLPNYMNDASSIILYLLVAFKDPMY